MTEVCPSLPKTKGQKPFMVVTKNSVKSNTTSVKSSPTKTKNIHRRKATNQKNNNQTSTEEILINDQPKSPIKKKNTTTINKINKKDISDTESRDIPRVQKLGKYVLICISYWYIRSFNFSHNYNFTKFFQSKNLMRCKI